MFLVTPNDINCLSDEDVRTIVARLCESEVRRRDYPLSVVTWGGNQNASDGGIDVRVSLDPANIIDGFIPRSQTGFQVKKPDMNRAAIIEEMCPGGTLRNSIKDLVDKSGAYIIVSTGSNLSDTMFQDRLSAMKFAVSHLPNSSDLTLDFIDRTRLATWVNDYPGKVLWVLEKVGRAISGWKPYGNWAYSPEGQVFEYLFDEKLTLKYGRNLDSGSETVIAGLKRMRLILKKPHGVVRLIGLSGVGKTRLVQALFENTLEGDFLDQSFACYTDMGQHPSVTPVDLATRLIADSHRAVLVIDNCTPELHEKLTKVCQQPDSKLSLITIEYDIRDDAPERTEVFTLEAASEELIFKLLSRRFSKVSQVDIRKIAEFSGGNSRIAIALADTVGDGESLANLNDEALFVRLFQQRHSEDLDLLLAAKAFSLVYSFSISEPMDGSISELSRLGETIEKAESFMFRQASEMYRRGLLQQRGEWRAVLPHAIANRLAKYALQDIYPGKIQKQIVSHPNGRMLLSFSRRLGFMHESSEAIRIVNEWLGFGGFLFDIRDFDELKKLVFKNIAPVAIVTTLSTLERLSATEEAPDKIRNYIPLIRSLAYDPELFERSGDLLVKIAQADSDDFKSSEALKAFSSLFYIHLSGTHANVCQRLDYLKKLIVSNDSHLISIGCEGIDAMLQVHRITSYYSFEFGAHTRDYGYHPKTFGEAEEWYRNVFSFIKNSVETDQQYASQLISIFGQNFRSLWVHLQIDNELEEISNTIVRKIGFWREGWLATKEILNYDIEELPQDSSNRINALEKTLKPIDLTQKIRAIALGEHSSFLEYEEYDLLEECMDARKQGRHIELIREFGRELGKDDVLFNNLLPELLSGIGYQEILGEGIAETCTDAQSVWHRILEQLDFISERDRNLVLLRGLLRGLQQRNPLLVNKFLDQVVEDIYLVKFYPFLQTAVNLDENALLRLKKSLANDLVPIEQFVHLSFGRATDFIADIELKHLLGEIVRKPNGGFNVAVDILYMKLFANQQKGKEYSKELVEAGRDILMLFEANQRDDRSDYRLEHIAKVALFGDDGVDITKIICSKLIKSAKDYRIRVYDYDNLLNALLTTQPISTLNAIFGGDEESLVFAYRLFEGSSSSRNNPFDLINNATFMKWCEYDPGSRYPILASIITPFKMSQDQKREWSDQALFILRSAPNKIGVLKRFIGRFNPNSWSGSRATVIESNMVLLDDIKELENEELSQFIKQEKFRLMNLVEQVRKTELERDRLSDERFE